MPAGRSATASFFICYRSGDTKAIARALSTTLEQQLGPGNVFIDEAGMQSGDFPSQLDQELRAATHVLVLVGKRWMTLLKKAEATYPTDWVQREAAYALSSKKAVLILVEGASLPPSELLSPTLKSIPNNMRFPLGRERGPRTWRAFSDGFIDRPMARDEVAS